MRLCYVSCWLLFVFGGSLLAGELHQAVQRGDINAVKSAFASNPDAINEIDKASGGTPLLLACIIGNKEIVEFLLENGADVNLDSSGVTPLHGAAYKGYNDIVLFLVAGGADMRAKTRNGLTPLDWAEKEGNSEVVRSLKVAVSLKKKPAEKRPPVEKNVEPSGEPDRPANPELPSFRTNTEEEVVEEVSITELDPRDKLLVALRDEVKKLTRLLDQAEAERGQLADKAREELEILRKAKNDEIIELEKIIEDVSESLDQERETSEQVPVLERRISVFDKKLQRAEDKRKELEKEYKAKLRTLEDARDRTTDELKREVRKLKEAESRMRSEYRDSSSEASRLKKKVEDLESDLNDANQRYEELKRTYETGIETIQTSRDKAVYELNATLDAVRESKEALQKACDKGREDVARLKQRISDMEQELLAAQAFASDVRGAFDTEQLNDRVAELESGLLEKEIENDNLRRELESTRVSYDNALADAARDIRTMQESQESKDARISELEETVRRLETSMSSELKDEKGVVSSLRSKVADLESELSSARKETTRLREDLRKAMDSRASLENSVKAELADKDRVISDLMRQLDEARKRMDQLSSKPQESPNEPRIGGRKPREAEVAEMGSRIVELAMKMKETIVAEGGDMDDNVVDGKGIRLGRGFDTEIQYTQSRTNGEITDFNATLVEQNPGETTTPEKVDRTQAPTVSGPEKDGNRTGKPDENTVARGSDVRDGRADGSDKSATPDIKGAGDGKDSSPDGPGRSGLLEGYTCAMHVHSSMSSGRYDLPELTRLSKERDIDVIFLSDSLSESIQFGLFPLRNIFWYSKSLPAVLTMGAGNYLDAIENENRRQSDVLYVPGVEIVPRFYWSGSLLKRNLVCHNHQRNLIVLGTADPGFLKNPPIVCGFLRTRDMGWIMFTRFALGLFLVATGALLVVPRILARRSGYGLNEIMRSYVLGFIFPAVLIIIGVNALASLVHEFDIYSPDNPHKFEQKVIDSLREQGLAHFWAHPEATDDHTLTYMGVRFKVNTQAYPELLNETVGYTGFGGVNEGRNRLIEPGAGWDRVLKDYIAENRPDPAWCFGEMLYHYEGQAGKKLGNIDTVVLAPERTSEALIASIRAGQFYARENTDDQKLLLDTWRLVRTRPMKVVLGVSSAVPGEKLSVQIIRDGMIIHESHQTTPFEVVVEDELPESGTRYYRALVKGDQPLRLVTNPLFASN